MVEDSPPQYVSLSVDGRKASIMAGDVNFAWATSNVTLNLSAADLPRLTLNLLVDKVEVEGEVVVNIPAKTHDLLVSLEWTPPGNGNGLPVTPQL